VKETVYSSELAQRRGWGIWAEMLYDLIHSSELIRRLVTRDFSIRYRQSILGYVWAVLPPVTTAGIFAYLNNSRVLPIGQTAIPYVAYAFWGICVWQLFAGCLTACTTSLTTAGSLVSKINFPREALVIAAVGQPLFDFIVRLFIVLIIFALYDVVPSAGAVFVPLVLLPVILLALGLGFVLAIANLAIRDTANVLAMALSVGMFLTPVLYPPPVRWPFYLVNFLNPLSPLLTATHDLIAHGTLSRPEWFAFSCLFSLLVFLGGWRFFHLTIPRVAAYA
jgi:lipopolysaccharide transport system permease protein